MGTLLVPPRPHRLDTLNTPLFINNVARVLHPTGGRHRGPPLRLRRLRRGSGDPHSFGLALGPSFPRGLCLALALAQGLRGSLVGLVAQRLPPRGPLLSLVNLSPLFITHICPLSLHYKCPYEPAGFSIK